METLAASDFTTLMEYGWVLYGGPHFSEWRKAMREEGRRRKVNVRTAIAKQFASGRPGYAVCVLRKDDAITDKQRALLTDRTGYHYCRAGGWMDTPLLWPESGWSFCPYCGEEFGMSRAERAMYPV